MVMSSPAHLSRCISKQLQVMPRRHTTPRFSKGGERGVTGSTVVSGELLRNGLIVN